MKTKHRILAGVSMLALMVAGCGDNTSNLTHDNTVVVNEVPVNELGTEVPANDKTGPKGQPDNKHEY